MTQYVIQGREQVKELPSDGDRPPLIVWKVSLTDPTGDVHVAELVTTQKKPPVEGEMEELELHEDPKWGLKAKRPSPQGLGGGGGSSPGSRSPSDSEVPDRFKKQPTHPEDAARMGRSVALNAAVAFGAYKKSSDPTKERPTAEEVVAVAGRFERFVSEGS